MMQCGKPSLWFIIKAIKEAIERKINKGKHQEYQDRIKKLQE